LRLLGGVPETAVINDCDLQWIAPV